MDGSSSPKWADVSGNSPKLGLRKFHNGWTKEQEKLMAEWADMAKCYRWLHDRCEKQFSRKNMWITIPVIILTTVTGTANFALGSLVGDDQQGQKYAQASIGAVSLLAGIMTTIGNYLRFAQGSEAHRMAGIAWGKFQRQVAVELALHPNERIECMDFLKICRAELDRLIEQSPAIPDNVLDAFDREFADVKDVKRPEICNGLEHTQIFEDTAARMKQVSSEAAIILMHKKRMLREEVLPDLDILIQKQVQKSVEKKIEDLSGQVMRPPPLVLEMSSLSVPTIPESRLFNVDYRRFLKHTAPTLSTLQTEATEIKKDIPTLLSLISPISDIKHQAVQSTTEQIKVEVADL
jgi:hypothetical protein